MAGEHQPITLREYVEQRINDQDRIWQTRLDASRTALELQAREYARRLDDLNHVYARTTEQTATFMRRDVYAVEREKLVGDVVIAKREADLKIQNIEATVAELREYRANIEGRMLIVSVGIGFVVTVINLALNILR